MVHYEHVDTTLYRYYKFKKPKLTHVLKRRLYTTQETINKIFNIFLPGLLVQEIFDPNIIN